MKNLKNKNILFSTDNILGYRESVEEELKKKFNIVEYIETELPPKEERTIYFKVLRELGKKIKIIERQYKKIIRKYSCQQLEKYKETFDYFLVVAGREFSPEFIQELKNKNKNIKCILYLWDKFEYTTLKNSAEEFDYIFSFDPEDCKKYGFIFRPIFYINECEENIIEYSQRKYDLFYIGALRDLKRYNIVNKCYSYCINNHLSFFLKLFTKSQNDKLNENILMTEKISYNKNREMLKNSKVVLDLNFSQQSGLTIRASEGIGSMVKLITTNKYIKDYDFYNENNIFYIEKEDDIELIPLEFFVKQFEKIPEEIKKRYTTKGFIEEVFMNIN